MNVELVLLTLEVLAVVGADSTTNCIKVDSHVTPRSSLGDNDTDLHDVLLRIEKFAKTELDLFAKSRS